MFSGRLALRSVYCIAYVSRLGMDASEQECSVHRINLETRPLSGISPEHSFPGFTQGPKEWSLPGTAQYEFAVRRIALAGKSHPHIRRSCKGYFLLAAAANICNSSSAASTEDVGFWPVIK